MTTSSPIVQSRPTFVTTTARQRVAATIVAATVTGSIGSALLWAFQLASPPQWLAPTPAVLSAVTRCELLPRIEQQMKCKQAYVVAQLAAPSHPAMLLAGR